MSYDDLPLLVCSHLCTLYRSACVGLHLALPCSSHRGSAVIPQCSHSSQHESSATSGCTDVPHALPTRTLRIVPQDSGSTYHRKPGHALSPPNRPRSSSQTYAIAFSCSLCGMRTEPSDRAICFWEVYWLRMKSSPQYPKLLVAFTI